MQQVIKKSLLFLAALIGFFRVDAQKKVQTFEVERAIPFPAEQVWAVVGEDYGYIAHSHPKIVQSSYINGTLEAGEGAERVCYFNEKGTQFLKEKMVDYDPANFTFKNTVYQTGKFPVDPEHTYAHYQVVPVDANSCKFVFKMQYRTKPAIMGGLMKGQFKKLVEDYGLAIEHHLATGEKVTKENFKEIKKRYTR